MMRPNTKSVGNLLVSVDDRGGHPCWTRIDGPGHATLNPEEARDLHYALSRVVAWLDYVERRDGS